MTKDNMAEKIDVELIKKAMFKILDDLNKSAMMYSKTPIIDYGSFYHEMQLKTDYINQLDVQFHDYWYYLGRHMLHGIKPTDEEVINLHDYANAIMAITW